MPAFGARQAFPQPAVAPPGTTWTHLWRCIDATGTNIPDSANGVDMTMAGANVALDPGGVVFGGSGDGHLDCLIADLLVDLKNFTGDLAIFLSATIQSAGAGGYGRYWNTRYDGKGQPIGSLCNSSNGTRVWHGDNLWDDISYDSGPVYPMDMDHALVRSDTETTPVATIYIREHSGALKSQIASSNIAARCWSDGGFNDFRIGNRGTNDRQLDGLVKWIGILNYAPDSTEIESIFSAGRPPAP